MFHQLYALIISLFFIIISTTFSEASRVLHDEKEHPYAVVIGSVYCDTCSQQTISKTNLSHYFISGALVAVECADINRAGTQFTKQVKTNVHGEFQVQLPFSSLNKIKKVCSVKLIGSNDPNCAVASTPTTTSLSKSVHLKSNNDQTHTIFSAGLLSFKPSNHPQLCNKKPKPIIHNFKKMLLQVPNNDEKISKTQFGIFPPIPFLPPPTIVPPIIPSPPSSIFPPIVPAPPPSIFPPILPSPPTTPPSIFPPFLPSPPSPPASPSPSLPIPLPPLPLPPLPPVPVFPGVPPAATSIVFP